MNVSCGRPAAATQSWPGTLPPISQLPGLPSDADSYSATNGMLTPDVDDLNADDWDFVRFQVEFDLNTSGGSVNLETPRPGIDLLRFSFRF